MVLVNNEAGRGDGASSDLVFLLLPIPQLPGGKLRLNDTG